MINRLFILMVFLIAAPNYALAKCFEGVSYETIYATTGKERQYGSTIEIIANKERSDGGYFIVTGFLGVDSHNRAFLYVDRESRENLIFSHSFFVDVDVNDKIQALDGKYVDIEAIYYKEAFHPVFAGRFADVATICPKMSLAEFNATRLK